MVSMQLKNDIYYNIVTFCWFYFARMAANWYSNCAKLASDGVNLANGGVRNCGPLYLNTLFSIVHTHFQKST